MIYSQKEAIIILFNIWLWRQYKKSIIFMHQTSYPMLLKAAGTLDVFVVIAHTNCDATMTPYYTVIPWIPRNSNVMTNYKMIFSSSLYSVQQSQSLQHYKLAILPSTNSYRLLEEATCSSVEIKAGSA